MSRYVLKPATTAGLRVLDLTTGETAQVAERVLDNMSADAAEEAIVLLDRLDALRKQHQDGAIARNDLIAILDERSRRR
jgi:hypothetical protein